MATSSVGTTYQVGDGLIPESFLTVGGIQSLGGPSTSTEEIDVSSHDSGRYKEFILGRVDSGEISVSFSWLNTTGQQQLRDAENKLVTHIVTFSDGSEARARGYVTSFEQNTELGSQLQAGATIRITGRWVYSEPTFTARMVSDLTTSAGAATLTRSSVAWHRNITSGHIEQVSSGTARYEIDPNGRAALLLEPASENILPYGQKPAGTGWSNGGIIGQYDTDAEVAPDNTLTATEFAPAISFPTSGAAAWQDLTGIADGDYVTMSVYIKAIGDADNPWVRLSYRHGDGTFTFRYFNAATGEKGGTTGTATAELDSHIRPHGNGWYRAEMTVENSGTGTTERFLVYIFDSDGGSATVASTLGNGTLFWGAQVEELPFSTSLMLTTGASTQTRASEYLTLPDIPRTSTTGAFSIRVCMKTDGTQIMNYAPSGLTIVGAVGETPAIFSYLPGGNALATGNFQHNMGAIGSPLTGGNSIETQVPAVQDVAYHLAIRYDANGESTFPGTKRFYYINGTEYADQDNSSPLTDDDFNGLGATPSGWTVGKGQFTSNSPPMWVSDFRWYELPTRESLKALTAS